jgi:pimeloyl-ACP methyl ester carboxylesterase
MSDAITPFHLFIPEAQLTDLQERLSRTRWPERETVDDTSQGPPLAKVQALCDYWRNGYDWRRCEALLNGFGQFKTSIDGLGIYFLHVRSPEPDALPLVMTHGWPGSVLEFHKVIGPLTDPAAYGGNPRQTFHVVVPSLPGFGFSDKPTDPGWNVPRIAGAWITLMERLGYSRWGAQGGDWGSAVTEAIGRKAPSGCIGLHFNLVTFQPTPEEAADATLQEQAMIASAKYYQDVLSGYAKEQSTRPQTIGYSLADSPVGLASWIYAMFQDVSDSGGNPELAFSLDEMLNDIMLYWLPNAGASSARLYWEMTKMYGAAPPSSGPVTIPAGFSMFPKELSRASLRWIDRRFSNVVHFNELGKGGHFAAMEQPDLFVDEIRNSFSSIR